MELTPDAHDILLLPLVTWNQPKQVRCIEVFGRLIIANAIDVKQKLPQSKSGHSFHNYQAKGDKIKTEYQKGEGHNRVRLMVEMSKSAMSLELQQPTTWTDKYERMFVKNNPNRIELTAGDPSFSIIDNSQRLRESISSRDRLREVTANYLERLESAADLIEVMNGRAANIGHRELLNYPESS